jgi:phosphatidylglycerophosphatase A
MVRKLLVTFFGLGYGPIAPGTWGSWGAIVIYLGIHFFFYPETSVPWWLLLVLIAAACVVCVTLGGWAVKFYNDLDPHPVVIDEAAGQWVSVLFVPMATSHPIVNPTFHVLIVCGAAFFLFRLFDVIKLPPARQLERLPAGWGILCDDLAAGIQANIILQILFRWLFTGAF